MAHPLPLIVVIGFAFQLTRNYMKRARGRRVDARGKFTLIAILAVIVVVALFQVVLALVVAK